MENQSDVRAPVVWMAPDWPEHRIDENFYGAGMSIRIDPDSPYDVVFSPMTKYASLYGHLSSPKKGVASKPSPTQRNEINSQQNLDGIQKISNKHVLYPIHTMREMTQDYGGDNPQGGMSPTNILREKLRRKLEIFLNDVETKIKTEMQSYNAQTKNTKLKSPSSSSLNFLSLLFCAASNDSPSTSHSDGLQRLCEIVSRAAYHRGLNQLQRHKRHLQSLLHIVSGNQVADTTFTAKELASLESVDQLFQFDLKYQLLSRQREWLHHLTIAREQCMSKHAGYHQNQSSPSVQMKRLLEAASWYRWLQEQESERCLNRQESISDILSGEDFFAEYFELMGSKEWWSVVQGQFENLVFSVLDARWCHILDKTCHDAATLYCETRLMEDSGTGLRRSKSYEYMNVHTEWLRDPQPEHVLELVGSITRRIRQTFAIDTDVNKSLYTFIQRTLYPRMVMLCYNGTVLKECSGKDKLWRAKQIKLRADKVTMEQLGVPVRMAGKLNEKWNSKDILFPDARQAFGAMRSLVPCDLLDEMMHGIIVLHQEAAQVFGTTRIAVDTFFPIFSYVLLHSDVPFVHAQLYLLEQYALANPSGDQSPTRNGEESYYVYCTHAAVEHICSFS